MNHTPGPWKAKRVSVNAGGIRISQSGYRGGSCVQAQEAAERQREANARLIAASPDLLEACEEILRMIPDDNHISSLLMSVIQKAKYGITE